MRLLSVDIAVAGDNHAVAVENTRHPRRADVAADKQAAAKTERRLLPLHTNYQPKRSHLLLVAVDVVVAVAAGQAEQAVSWTMHLRAADADPESSTPAAADAAHALQTALGHCCRRDYTFCD